MLPMPARRIANRLLRRPGSARGFTLVELMIAITLALFVIGGLILLFVGSSRSARELDATNRQIENGQYALQVLGNEFHHAGYLGYFNPDIPAVATPAALPNPCATGLADLVTALPLHIQGYDGDPGLACLSDVKAGSDVVVIRRASVCVTGSSADCAVESGMPYFQASSCQSSTQLASPDVTNHYRLATNRALLDRTKRDCATPEEDRRYLVRIFYVANNYEAGDGIPTLKRVELGAGSFSSPVAISPGIESMQLEYGVDSNEDGAPDVFTANPNTLTDPDTGLACAAAKCAQFWRDTVAVKAYLLARTNKPLAGQVDEKEFHLGLAADGSEMVVSAANDGHRRSVYQTLARLNNPSMRRE